MLLDLAVDQPLLRRIPDVPHVAVRANHLRSPWNGDRLLLGHHFAELTREIPADAERFEEVRYRELRRARPRAGDDDNILASLTQERVVEQRQGVRRKPPVQVRDRFPGGRADQDRPLVLGLLRDDLQPRSAHGFDVVLKLTGRQLFLLQRLRREHDRYLSLAVPHQDNVLGSGEAAECQQQSPCQQTAPKRVHPHTSSSCYRILADRKRPAASGDSVCATSPIILTPSTAWKSPLRRNTASSFRSCTSGAQNEPSNAVGFAGI